MGIVRVSVVRAIKTVSLKVVVISSPILAVGLIALIKSVTTRTDGVGCVMGVTAAIV